MTMHELIIELVGVGIGSFGIGFACAWIQTQYKKGLEKL